MIYFIGTIYKGKSFLSKIVSFVAKRNGHKLPFTHSAILLKYQGEWKVLEITTKGFQEHSLNDYIRDYEGEIYFGTFTKIKFTQELADRLYGFFQEDKNDPLINKYDYMGAGNSFKFKTQPWAFLLNNTLGKYLNYKDKKTQGTFCSELAFKLGLSVIYTVPNVDFSSKEMDFFSKNKLRTTTDFKKIYPAMMSDVFCMQPINHLNKCDK